MHRPEPSRNRHTRLSGSSLLFRGFRDVACQLLCCSSGTYPRRIAMLWYRRRASSLSGVPTGFDWSETLTVGTKICECHAFRAIIVWELPLVHPAINTSQEADLPHVAGCRPGASTAPHEAHAPHVLHPALCTHLRSVVLRGFHESARSA